MKQITQIGNSVLLHICCGVCLPYPVQKLRDDGYTVYGYFFNPNIYPIDEYETRLNALKKISEILELEIVVGDYDHNGWLKKVLGYENEKEGGQRCSICFQYRLEQTFILAKQNGFNKIATTLSISPHKDTQKINTIGTAIAGNYFLPYDFKLDDGFKKSKEIAKANSIYCQKYCGCEFSLR